MHDDLERLVTETHALAKENNRILRSLWRYQWFSFAGKIVIWAIVLLVPLYLYQQYVIPLIEKFTASASSTPSELFSVPTSADIQKLLDSYNVKKE